MTGVGRNSRSNLAKTLLQPAWKNCPPHLWLLPPSSLHWQQQTNNPASKQEVNNLKLHPHSTEKFWKFNISLVAVLQKKNLDFCCQEFQENKSWSPPERFSQTPLKDSHKISLKIINQAKTGKTLQQNNINGGEGEGGGDKRTHIVEHGGGTLPSALKRDRTQEFVRVLEREREGFRERERGGINSCCCCWEKASFYQGPSSTVGFGFICELAVTA